MQASRVTDGPLMTVYVLASEKARKMKVGLSGNVSRRADEIRFKNPYKPHRLVLVRAWRNQLGDELAAHRLLEPFWISGEWYEYTPESIALLDERFAAYELDVDALEAERIREENYRRKQTGERRIYRKRSK